MMCVMRKRGELLLVGTPILVGAISRICMLVVLALWLVVEGWFLLTCVVLRGIVRGQVERVVLVVQPVMRDMLSSRAISRTPSEVRDFMGGKMSCRLKVSFLMGAVKTGATHKVVIKGTRESAPSEPSVLPTCPQLLVVVVPELRGGLAMGKSIVGVASHSPSRSEAPRMGRGRGSQVRIREGGAFLERGVAIQMMAAMCLVLEVRAARVRRRVKIVHITRLGIRRERGQWSARVLVRRS